MPLRLSGIKASLWLVIAINLSWLLYPAFFPQFKTAAIIVEHKKNPNKQILTNQIDSTYKKLKASYQDDSGQTYLLEVDPYAWTRATRFVLERGYPGTSRIGRTVYDNFMLAPQGGKVQPQRFLFYSAAWLYRINKGVWGQLRLETFLFYLPIFFAVVFFIILYYFCGYFFSRLSGILTVLFIGFTPIFIARSCAGRFDSDVLSLILPLAIIWLLAAGLKAIDYKKTALLSFLAGFALSIFAATWVGWWFIFVVSLVFYLYYMLRARNKLRVIISAAAFFVSSEFFCLILLRSEPFSQTIGEITSNMSIAVPASLSLWPNVYRLVSELLPLDFQALISSCGNVIVLCLYAFSIVWVVLKQRQANNHPITMLLLFWLLVMGFISYSAQRFILFAMVPACIFLGVFLTELAGRIIGSLRKYPQSVRVWIVAVSCLLVAASLAQSLYSDAHAAAAKVRPLLTDDYYDLLQLLRTQTPSESIIDTWWDYGNWIKEIADRRVLFDPQSQNRPVAYWFSRALLENDETTALRILRMLNNSSDKLFYDMQAELNDGLKCVTILNEILTADRGQIDKILQAAGLSESLQAEIKEAIFEKKPAPAYLVLDKDMLGKISSISYLANWDFAKADTRRWWFNPSLGKSHDLGNSVHFSNGIVFERDTLTSRIFSLSEKKFRIFKTTLFFDGKRLNVQPYPSGELPGGALITRSGDEWQSIGFSDQDLGMSMLSRLFFMQGEGLKHFELCFANDDAGIYAYEIKW